MSTTDDLNRGPATRDRWIRVTLLALALAWFLFNSALRPAKRQLWDYALLASSAAVWVDGGDAYDDFYVRDRWNAQRPGFGLEIDSEQLKPVSPPSTLVALAPFGVLPPVVGAAAWMIVTTAMTGVAALVVGRWTNLSGAWPWTAYWLWILAGGPMALALRSGNPVGLVIPLALIGLAWSVNRPIVAGLLLAIATALKPQLVLPLIVYLGFVGRWRVVSIALVGSAAMLLVGIGRLELAGVDWKAGLLRNLAALGRPGGLNDFENPRPSASDFLMLQTSLWQLVPNRLTVNVIAWTVALVGTAWLAIVGWRKRSGGERSTQLGLMAAAALSIVPLYHRPYDAPILLPLLALSLNGLRAADRLDRRLCILSVVCFLPYCLPGWIPAYLVQPRGFPWLQENAIYRAFFVCARPWTVVAHAAIAIGLLRRSEKTFVKSVEA